MSKSALASLTAQYTDSENEDFGRDEEDTQDSQVIFPTAALKREEEPPASENVPSTKKKKRSKKVRRLVSYQDDMHDEVEELSSSSSSSSSESEESDANTEQSSSGKATNGSGGSAGANAEKGLGVGLFSGGATAASSPMQVDDDEAVKSAAGDTKSTMSMEEKCKKYAHYGFSLPPEPKGQPASELVEKIQSFHDKIKNSNLDMNKLIQNRKDFRNPSIYEKLIQYCDINEFGTNYPPEIYDPLQWGAESYYEELALVQKNEMLKRQKERKESDKIEQATVLARKVEEEAKKRKSKWDQPTTVAKPVLASTLTTTVTGTKGTVISAFGNLPKRIAP